MSKLTLGFFTSILLLSGCGIDLGNGVFDTSQSRTIDGIKLISTDIHDREDPASFNQVSYHLHQGSRLLLRFQKMMDEQAAIRTEDSHHVEIRVAVIPSADPTPLSEIAAKLRVCPLDHNWMNWATWDRAHFWGRDGKWGEPGGDFNPRECVVGKVVADSPNWIGFDVTPGFLEHMRGRSENFGFILLADVPAQKSITIAGEKSRTLSPKILWETSANSSGFTPLL